MFKVQFGHAGASAHNDQETAVSKNKVCSCDYLEIHFFVCRAIKNIFGYFYQALKEAGAVVPESFDSLFEAIR